MWALVDCVSECPGIKELFAPLPFATCLLSSNCRQSYGKHKILICYPEQRYESCYIPGLLGHISLVFSKMISLRHVQLVEDQKYFSETEKSDIHEYLFLFCQLVLGISTIV